MDEWLKSAKMPPWFNTLSYSSHLVNYSFPIIVLANALNQTLSYFFVCTAQNPEEISVQAREKVTIIEIPGDGWMKIRSENGEGYIPESYAQIE